jgi:murein DD-endopeptidase MepM/ murein hydrolase activator NlpD
MMSKIKTRINRIFADKQIYIRSQGKVTFVPLSTRSQILLSSFLMAVCLWVGFASVNVLFQDRIVNQREAQLREMQLAYETELSRLQRAYDDLNAQLVLTRDWFTQTTDKLEARHNQLNTVMEQNARVSSNLRSMQEAFASVAKRSKRNKSAVELVGRTSDQVHQVMKSRNLTASASPAGLRLAQNVAADTVAAATPLALPHVSKDVYSRITSLDTRQRDMLDALEESVDEKVREFEEVIAGTDILDTENFMARVLPESALAIGGPYIPLSDRAGLNSRLHQQIYRISNNLDRLQNLSQSMTKIPLATPIHDYSLTSGFGARMDPFKKRAAFHAGVDFGTPTGTPVHTTLPGTVTQAGYKGPYGLMVEIDHGNGFRTRYAHLNRSRVQRGQRVEFQQHIADAGNSGRSTGPHLHYEIWFDGKVRDPIAFLNTGKQIFNIAETIESKTE